MSPVFFDIISLIIDIVAENKDTDLLKELALVSYSFHQICIKHLFSTIDLHDAEPKYNVPSTKNGFVKLLKSRPDVFKYIRDLTYSVSRYNDDSDEDDDSDDNNDSEDHLLSPILPNFLRTISHLNSLTIDGSKSDWNTLDSALKSAFLYLIHLPSIDYIKLAHIQNFPLSSFIPSVNLIQQNHCTSCFPTSS